MFFYDVSCADFCCVQKQKIPYKNRAHPPEGFHSKKPLPADFSLRQRHPHFSILIFLF